VYETARRRAFEQRRPLGDVVSELVKRGLAAEQARPVRRPIGLYAGQGRVADDFDATPSDVSESLERGLE
jgi:hypothetical protein